MFPNHNQMSLKCKPENRAESTFILVFLLWASVILVFNLSSFGMYRTQGRRMTLTLSLRSAHLGSQPIPKYNYNFLNPHVPQTLRYALLQLDSFLHLLTANAMPPRPGSPLTTYSSISSSKCCHEVLPFRTEAWKNKPQDCTFLSVDMGNITNMLLTVKTPVGKLTFISISISISIIQFYLPGLLPFALTNTFIIITIWKIFFYSLSGLVNVNKSNLMWHITPWVS